ncbi:MAG: OmpA family protein [Flavobacteriaceae bacterium]|nr:OmpA family protein [Flavobacteriaceae bacterium]
MKLRTYLILVSILALGWNGYSQKGNINKALKDYDKFSYIKTSDILLDVAERGYESADLFEKLGNAFYFNNKMDEAAGWYGRLMDMDRPVDPELYYRYAQTLKFSEQYEESDKWMERFANARSEELRARGFLSKRDYLESIEGLSETFPVTNLDLNTEWSDFGANQYMDKFIFASSRDTKEKTYNWNEQPFLELYSATKQEDGSLGNVEKFDDNINTKFHESSVSFWPTDDVVYFTRNNYYKRNLRRDDDGVNRLHMYLARLQRDGSWAEIEPIHFNSEQYSVAHPTVNVYGTRVYFASDMPGTIGQADLFMADINDDGTLGEPVHLGAALNTEGQESFPYVNSKGDLYYASNGLPGLGGLDVFMVRDFEKKLDNHEQLIVENAGKPINSEKDDFAYYENLGTKEGFFTSNRDGGKGDDDIYFFNVPDCLQDLEGIVFDEKTRELIPGAKVRLFDQTGQEVSEMVVGDDAKYSFKDLNCDKEYLVRVEKDSYSTDEDRIATTDNRKLTLNLDLEITRDEVAVTEGTNLREALDLNPIYFDLDKWNIRPDAEVELQKVIAVLNQYPDMTIDVQSHTDSRATNSYNEALSRRRNNSTIRYIIEVGGIDPKRLSGRGYGESSLTNDCGDGANCSEEEHQLNRRSDFIIIEM